jgi:hypothetical protein
MPPIRNIAVAQGILTTTGGAVLYTVPANNAFIFKWGGFNNLSGVADAVTVNIYHPANGAYVQVLNKSIAAGASELLAIWTVLNGGDQITIGVNAQPLHYWLAGALLPYVI